jgi:hypothetical protein
MGSPLVVWFTVSVTLDNTYQRRNRRGKREGMHPERRPPPSLPPPPSSPAIVVFKCEIPARSNEKLGLYNKTDLRQNVREECKMSSEDTREHSSLNRERIRSSR